MSIEDRPPSQEQRYMITVDLLKLVRRIIGEPYDSSEHPISDYRTTRLNQIDKRIDDAIARANGTWDRSRKENCSS